MRTKPVEYTGWGRTLSATSDTARPERQSSLAAAMDSMPAPPLGSLRSYGDACLNDAKPAISTVRLDRVTAFDADTGLLTAEPGVRIGDLVRRLAPLGWLPPVMPGTGFATVGGSVAMDVHGKNHHHAGSFGQHVTALALVTPKGRKTAKTGSELFKATVGGLGQTGAIASAEMQLLRCKGDVMMVTERRIGDWDEHLGLLDASEATYTVGWIDATATGRNLGRGVLEEGETGAGLVPPAKRGRRVPFDAPSFALSSPIVRLFNAAYWRRIPQRGRTVVKPIDDFFFPLDKIHDWNRLYGKAGFHQFQCVVPLDQAPALRQMLETIAKSGLASPLAVLKRMGPGRAGYMSFPMEGYTLAVDFPNRGRARHIVEGLTEAARDAGGRIYFAKDSVATPELIAGMYPEQAKWVKAVAKLDPERALQTDLVRRLDLRGVA
ncbi:MAG: FAD-binding oxidoreductase [Alphaproteobacteria bacterium]|nr:FAD-binding oxidoreductase [Alphaproteobacteria bacterium]NNF24733.1 FAD-binding oxidoreductase [Paracoccaceae bacterium]